MPAPPTTCDLCGELAATIDRVGRRVCTACTYAPLATPHKADAVRLYHPAAGAVMLILDEGQKAKPAADRLNVWLEKLLTATR